MNVRNNRIFCKGIIMKIAGAHQHIATGITLGIAALVGLLILSLSAAFPVSATQQPQKIQVPQPPKPPQQTPPDKKKADKDDKDQKRDKRQGAEADDQPNDGDSVKINTELVQLDVNVVDQNNNPVYDMTKADFTVFEDKVKQELDNVSREEVPLSFGVVIDTSGSMRSKLQTITDASAGLIKQMKAEDEAFIAQFKAEAELEQEFTRDKGELEEALNRLYVGGSTSLLDAIYATAEYASQKGRQRRKAIIVISDGLETTSAIKEKEVQDAMKEYEVQLYLVGFVDEEDEAGGGIFKRSRAKKARELLVRLAEDSGGRAFFPKEISEMTAVAQQIAKDLRTQYVLSYYPNNQVRDGAFRSVRVVVNQKDNRKLIARTRQGYYSKKSGATPATEAK
jgi:Ca-activated chloride channel family protein